MPSKLTTRISRASKLFVFSALVYFAGALTLPQISAAQACPCFTEEEIVSYCKAGGRESYYQPYSNNFAKVKKRGKDAYKTDAYTYTVLSCGKGYNNFPHKIYLAWYHKFIWKNNKSRNRFMWHIIKKHGQCQNIIRLSSSKKSENSKDIRNLTYATYKNCLKIIKKAKSRLVIARQF
jgi:hypothetical protein